VIEIRIHIEALDPRSVSRSDRLTLLRAQLTLLRMRAEQGIPVSVDSLARTESLARTLESQGLAA
jgi:hypothetical protein